MEEELWYGECIDFISRRYRFHHRRSIGPLNKIKLESLHRSAVVSFFFFFLYVSDDYDEIFFSSFHVFLPSPSSTSFTNCHICIIVLASAHVMVESSFHMVPRQGPLFDKMPRLTRRKIKIEIILIIKSHLNAFFLFFFAITGHVNDFIWRFFSFFFCLKNEKIKRR